uniref:Protein kinase domain-containing protein n=1 Tax=Oryza meridionalis TaxID=40149 RepID=A0A0E0ETC7_9ORYZ
MAASPVILVLMAVLFLQAATMAATTALTVSLPGCPSSCGSMVIPYPFGVGAGCHLSGAFAVTCNHTYHPPKLFLGDADAAEPAEVLEISLVNSTVIVSSAVRYDAAKGEGAWGRGLAGAFRLRERRNRLVVVGCNLQAVLLDGDDIAAACTTICGGAGAGATWPAAADGEFADYSCAGVGCCQASIYLGLRSYGVRLSPFGTSTGPPPPPTTTSSASSSNQSASALVFVADNEWFGGNASKLGSAAATMRPGGGGGDMPAAPAVLDWAIGKSGCPPHGSDDTACSSSNSYCRNSTSTSLGGYSCQCDNGYQGNPYVANGCQALLVAIGGTIGLGIPSLFVIGMAMTNMIKARRAKKLRAVFFKQNRGLLLQQLVDKVIAERMVFTLEELEKATNRFDEMRKLGSGGHGTVYEGTLPDRRVVAIKKSNITVPLLIYEFISNGTLSDHLHVEGPTSLSWKNRLRIALEAASALAYLHSSASVSIIHRDVKSANILLDGRLTAKVSDFGASRGIPVDQGGVTTVIQGTFGYLDPEYYQTSRLTVKSDVYSFGVILVEMLTRKKPTIFESSANVTLIALFNLLMVQDNIYEILDPQVISEGMDNVKEVAALASACLRLKGKRGQQ